MRATDSASVTRRGFLLSAGGTTAAAAASNPASAQEDAVIDMTDELVFDPDSTTIAPGTTVVWENVGDIGHSVTAYEEEIPDDAEYFASGGFEDEQSARDAYPDGDIPGGESFEHTFEVEGTYGYFCVPHESAGMVAELTVSAGGDGGDGGGEGGGGGDDVVPEMPEVVRTAVIALVGAMVVVVALGYFFLKYGGDYGPE
ncbi:plastocyanin/azurin family copper-binding protein [Halomicrobium urmianum]|uniref:plastocyanin/azurin family copper-binding protein n=1 Tax=Halomicrobium urmianum TaxID=1586233 RepID=UPI001CD9B6C3|nr:plastocyanin/azurin family copper-binding protein [Halomicrobium urmianum]